MAPASRIVRYLAGLLRMSPGEVCDRLDRCQASGLLDEFYWLTDDGIGVVLTPSLGCDMGSTVMGKRILGVEGSRYLVECICGERSLISRENLDSFPCCSACRRHGRTRDSAIDPLLPYDQDYECRDFVARHPSGALLEEIGAALGVARQRVKAIEESAIRTLRESNPKHLSILARSLGKTVSVWEQTILQ